MRLNCYKNADWPDEKKDEIDKAIKKCLEVVLFFILSHSKNSLNYLLTISKEIRQQK